MRRRNWRPVEGGLNNNRGEKGTANEYPLSSANSGESVEVVNLAGGRHFISKITSLGLTPGTNIRVLSNLGGPIIIDVRGSRISLGRGMAQKVIVH